MDVREKRNFIAVLTIAVSFFVIMQFVSVFLAARIFMLTGEDFVAIGLYLIVVASGTFLSFFLSSMFCKRFKPIYMTQIMTVFACAFLVVLLLFQDHLENYFLLFGFAWGMVQGLYTGSTSIMISTLFKAKGTRGFIVWRKISRGASQIVFPVTIGLLIDLGDFSLSIIAVLAVSVILVVATFFIKYPEFKGKMLQPKKYFQFMKEKGAVKQSKEFWFVALTSAPFYKMTIMSTTLIVIAFGSNIGLGGLKSVAPIIMMSLLFMYHKSSPKSKTRIYWVAAILPPIVAVSLFFGINMVTVSLFFFIKAINQIISMEEMSTRLNATKYWGGEEFIIESNLFFEIPKFIGSIISSVMIMMIGIIGVYPWVIATIAIIMLSIYLVHSVLLFRWKNKYAQSKN